LAKAGLSTEASAKADLSTEASAKADWPKEAREGEGPTNLEYEQHKFSFKFS
jgi:hypothetical protein